ncbi:MAG: adenylyl-sulfate kinase [Hyphomicrobium sp.]|jgi:adenylyl-sulfate kinase
MQNTRPDARNSAPRLKICLTDAIGAPALFGRLRSHVATLGITEGDVSIYPDVILVLVDAAGFSPQTRQTVAVARTAGARHVVLAVAAPIPSAHAGLEAIRTALQEFAAKLEFATAAALPADDTDALRDHLTQLPLSHRYDEPADCDAPVSGQFAAHIACVSEHDLLPGREYRVRLPGAETTASVTAVKYRLDLDSLRRVPARALARGEIGACTIATEVPLALGEACEGAASARFTLSDLFTDEVIAAGSVDFALRRGMNVHWQPFTVTKELRAAAKDQRPCIVWFTGLSGAGKSTIANLVEGWLALQGRHTYLLDGDNVRHGLNKDLGFTAADRVENIRRVGEVARLFVDSGLIVLCSFISPFRAEREQVRSLVGADEFIEIHVTAPLEVCERRDPKGLYAKCRAGHLPNFTGIDSPYEAPERPDLVLDTTTASASELAQRVVALLQARGVVCAPEDHAIAMHGL